jgi:hypothetical protein
MPFIPDEDALRLAIYNDMLDGACPFAVIRSRSHRISKDIDVDGCIPFDEAESDLQWLGSDTLDEIKAAGHVIVRLRTPGLNGLIARSWLRQVYISSNFLSAAAAKAVGWSNDELRRQAGADWHHNASRFNLDGLSFNFVRSERNFKHYVITDDCWLESVIANLVSYDTIYSTDFQRDVWNGRIHFAIDSAVESVTRDCGDFATPLQEFLPRENAQFLPFRTMLLRAFHGSQNCAWHVNSLAPIAAALRVVIAVGRLARDQKVPLTAGLVRDTRVLRDPWTWIANANADRRDAPQLYIAIARFVENIIGADELASLATQQPALIPDQVWTPPRVLPLLPELKLGWLQV